MIGLFQLLILLCCSLSKILPVTDEQFIMPFPLELSLSQDCKEKGQLQCQDSCGWASCVPASDTYVHNAYYECCPYGYAFKCCAMLPKMKYNFVLEDTAVMYRKMHEKCEDKSGFCVCQPHWQMMNGMCCYTNLGCACCFLYLISLPRLAYFPDRIDEKKECRDQFRPYPSFCIWMQGVPETHCCPQNYQLAPSTLQFVSVVTEEGSQRSMVPPRQYRSQRIPLSAWIRKEGFERPDLRCDFELKFDGWSHTEDRSGGFLKTKLTHHMADRFECASGSFWVTKLLPALTTVPPDDRKYTWMKKDTTEMVREMDSKQECKKSTVFCACDALHFDQMMNGMCCDTSTDCGCCRTDSTISKRPMLASVPSSSPSCKDQIKEQIRVGDLAMCQWAEGWKASSCCNENYKLVAKDKRYGEQETPHGELPSHVSIKGINRRYPLCRDDLPWIYPTICAWDWYWVPKVICDDTAACVWMRILCHCPSPLPLFPNNNAYFRFLTRAKRAVVRDLPDSAYRHLKNCPNALKGSFLSPNDI